MKLGEGPALLLAEHLEGEAPVLVHRVEDLEASLAQLERRGLDVGEPFGIPHGPCVELATPGGQRLALVAQRLIQVRQATMRRTDVTGQLSQDGALVVLAEFGGSQ